MFSFTAINSRITVYRCLGVFCLDRVSNWGHEGWDRVMPNNWSLCLGAKPVKRNSSAGQESLSPGGGDKVKQMKGTGGQRSAARGTTATKS